jgi:hypothetical protein
VRVVARWRHRALVYRGRLPVIPLVLILVAGALTTGALTGRLLVGGVVAAVLVVGWIAYGMRITRLTPAGPGGNGPTPPGGAGVREPRRPLPVAPAGAAERQIGEDEPPDRAVALA